MKNINIGEAELEIMKVIWKAKKAGASSFLPSGKSVISAAIRRPDSGRAKNFITPLMSGYIELPVITAMASGSAVARVERKKFWVSMTDLGTVFFSVYAANRKM